MNKFNKIFRVDVDFIADSPKCLSAYDIESAIISTLQSLESDGYLDEFEGISVTEEEK